ncbi:glycosyltransferase family 4 protein [Chryseobacterium echinoideorum]|uniref:glycosyltransferase family 4 protein n=1 Tax=Chryseobacterium echinoideorum TaxID=1549648 RepID=UPI001185384B|nr:glycosyltransferase family 1 protein [Chryseobacterium echinoideorum]
MILGIDASNIKAGGGLTHLKEIIKCGNPEKFGINKVIVWSNNNTLKALPDNTWLVKRTHPYLNKSSFWSFIFQIFILSNKAKKENCNLIFVPGGTFLGTFRKIVSMSQNMLPFEKLEQNRFTAWKTKLRFQVLYFTQSITFKKSKAVIFLTSYAKNYIIKKIKLKNRYEIIPHGINLNFLNEPKTQNPISFYSKTQPFKLLYVSIVTVYKHQWNVAEAVIRLNKEGYPVELDLVGDFINDSLEKVNKIKSTDKYNCINYKGLIPYEELASIYKNADGFIFASSCENMPIILIEAMTAGLPISSSNMGPMPEVLKDGGFYFDPLDVNSIYLALKEMLDNEKLRQQKSLISYNNSISYTWKECSDKTFYFLSTIAKQS